jgi:hypothetical protein
MPGDEPHQYMVDPSMVLSDSWLTWVEEEANEDEIREVVVSQALLAQLREVRDRAFFPWLPEDHQEDYLVYRERALDLIEGRDIRSFSFDEVDLPDELRAVLVALLETGDRDAGTLADEWAFLKSQSWLLSANHVSTDAFRRRGASVVRITHRFTRALAKQVISKEKIPERFTPRFLAKVGAKWVVWGTATTAGGVGGGVGGTLIAGPIGGLAGGSGGAWLVGAGAQAALLEWDP